MNSTLYRLLAGAKRLFPGAAKRVGPLLRRLGLLPASQQPCKIEVTTPLAIRGVANVNHAVNRNRKRAVNKQRGRRTENDRAPVTQPRLQRRSREPMHYLRGKAESASSAPAMTELVKTRLTAQNHSTPDVARDQVEQDQAEVPTCIVSAIPVSWTAKSIVVISDNAEAMLTAREIADKGNSVTVLFTANALATDEKILQAASGRIGAVSSLQKYFYTPLSDIEARSAALGKSCASGLFDVLKKVAGRHICDGIVDALTLGLEHHLYSDALTFNAAESCLKQFDLVLLAIRNPKPNSTVINSFLYHGRARGASDSIFRGSPGSHILKLDESVFQSPKPAHGPIDEDRLVADFDALWQGLQDPAFEIHSGREDYFAVCGNVSRDNYGNAPTSFKLVEVLARRGDCRVLFHSSTLLNKEGQHEARRAILSKNLHDNCTVYDGWARGYELKYSSDILEKSSLFSGGVFEMLIGELRKTLPSQLIDIFQPRIFRYVQSLFTYFIFISESIRAMDRCKLVATAVDRSMISRILCAIAKDKGIPSIGVQTMLMSESPRYVQPAVDRMGVIDSGQVQVFIGLGARREALEVIGSVNYVERLSQLDSYRRAMTAPPDSRAILFAMQHSYPDLMARISVALREIVDRHDLRLVVKPHPNQELPVLHDVQRIFADRQNVSVLNRESDTYAAIPQCGMIVGLNSNVLLEAALVGKPVLVAAFDELHPSGDLSLIGVALKATDKPGLEQCILDIVSEGPLSKRLEKTRSDYLRGNPQFSPPHSYELIESFIVSAVSADAAAVPFKPRLAVRAA